MTTESVKGIFEAPLLPDEGKEFLSRILDNETSSDSYFAEGLRLELSRARAEIKPRRQAGWALRLATFAAVSTVLSLLTISTLSSGLNPTRIGAMLGTGLAVLCVIVAAYRHKHDSAVQELAIPDGYMHVRIVRVQAEHSVASEHHSGKHIPYFAIASVAFSGMLLGLVIGSAAQINMGILIAIYLTVAGLGLGLSSIGFVLMLNDNYSHKIRE